MRITVDTNEVLLGDLLDLIAAQTGIPFSFNPKRLPLDRRVSYKAADRPLELVVAELSQQLGLSFAFMENQIILKPQRGGSPSTSKITLSGYVKDRNSGEALIGAAILLDGENLGAVTNAFGFYSITVPPGAYDATCSFIGFKREAQSFDLAESRKIDFMLAEEPPVLNEVIVSGVTNDITNELQTSKMELRPQAIEERPAMFGEMDVIKSLESVPGIKLHSDGSTFYYVRGGNRDQNLVLIDDAPIYNPSHLLGIFSTIIPDAANSIDVYKGEMPASYGGRLSSLLNVHTRKGNDQHFRAWGSANLISNKLGVEGPFRKDVSSYLVSGRFSRLKWFATLLDDNVRQFQFHDLTGKLNFALDARNRLLFSFYTGSDSYISGNAGLSWSNNTGTFKWNRIVGNRLFINTTLSASGYDYFLHADLSKNTKWNSHISNGGLKSDFSFFMKPGNELTFGIGLSGYFFNPGNLQTSDPNISLPALSVRNVAEGICYVNHEVKLSPHWGINYGVRMTSWSSTGEAFEFVFDSNRNPVDTLFYSKGQSYKTYGNAEPRLTLVYAFNDHTSIKAGYSRNVQNIHQISNSISPFTSLEVWLPSSINIKPQLANQLSLGFYSSVAGPGLSFALEAYHKKMTNQIDYETHAETLLNPLLERELRFGRGKAYGVEVLVRKEEGRLRGWTGYSYARSERRFSAINGGVPFKAFSDRPHQLNVALAWDLNLRWNLGMNWSSCSGAPFSSPISYYSFNGQEVPVYGQRNNDRLPGYHRLDISAAWKLNKDPSYPYQHSLSFSVFNLFGRRNPIFINNNKVAADDGSLKIPSDLLAADRLTSQRYLFRAMPSVSYNFALR